MYLVGASVEPPHPPVVGLLLGAVTSWRRTGRYCCLSCVVAISLLSLLLLSFSSPLTHGVGPLRVLSGGREGFCLYVRSWGDLVLNSGV